MTGARSRQLQSPPLLQELWAKSITQEYINLKRILRGNPVCSDPSWGYYTKNLRHWQNVFDMCDWDQHHRMLMHQMLAQA